MLAGDLNGIRRHALSAKYSDQFSVQFGGISYSVPQQNHCNPQSLFIVNKLKNLYLISLLGMLAM